jgi:tyrosine-protein kinase Etk/Wzc
MNDIKTPASISVPDRNEVSMIELLTEVAKRKKTIIWFSIAVTLVAAVASIALPDSFKANAKLLPPQQSQSGAAALLSQLGGMAGAAASVTGIKNPNDMYVGILKSRTVADRLISQFDLKKNYDTESLDKTRKILDEKTSITSGKDGIIVIEVEDNNKKLVAQLANAYIDELTRLTRTLAVTEASRRRLFFERQLEQSKNNLAKAEATLKGGLDAKGVISVDVESRAIMETMARLKAQISAKEIQLNAMGAFVTAAHPDYRRTREELTSLQGELEKMENGRASSMNLSANTGANKAERFENIQLLRDVKYYQMLYELLAKQYEVARLDEAKEPSIIQVLDPAVEPERKFKPKRAFLTLGAGIAAFLLAIIYSIFMAAKDRALRNPVFKSDWDRLKQSLRLR